MLLDEYPRKPNSRRRSARGWRTIALWIGLIVSGLIFYNVASGVDRTATRNRLEEIWYQASSGSIGGGSGISLKMLAQRTVLARKTGYSVVFERLPMHLVEKRPDIPHQYIYSDANVKLGDVDVIDILANVSDAVKDQHAFSGYARLQRAIRDRQPPENGWGAWNVDKYKFLPLHGDLYRRHPDAEWFISVDGDTYLFYTTLLRYLARFDPNEQYFFGLANHHGLNGAGNTTWANGGAGYVFSKGVMDKTYALDPWGFEHAWDQVLADSPGGDVAIARAVYQSSGITLNNSLSAGSPMFTSENSGHLEFTRDTWLSPLFTLHHLKAFEIHDLRDFEKKRLEALGHQDGIRYCDLFNHLAPAFLTTALALYDSQDLPEPNLQRRGWSITGGSQIYYPPVFAQVAKEPYDVHFCEKLCDGEPSCLTWVWDDDGKNPPRCSLSKRHFKMGWPEARVTSGWRLDRISKLRKELPCDDLVTRKLADLERFGQPNRTSSSTTITKAKKPLQSASANLTSVNGLQNEGKGIWKKWS